MAASAKFEADFTQFNQAVDSAVAKLRDFKVVVDNTGNTSLGTVEKQAIRTSNSFGQLSQGLSAADKTLGAFGVHIGPEIHALEELSQAAGASADSIGLLGKASLVAAAAFGAWEFGRKIAEWTDADNKIAHLADRVLGLGMAAQEAGAKQDSINLAISRGADATVNYTQAVQFNTEWAAKSNDRVKEAAEITKAHEKAMLDAAKAAEAEAEALQKLQAAHIGEIQKLQDSLFGADDIKRATDYVEALGRVENVANLDAEALQTLFDSLTNGISSMVQQGLAADDLTNQMEQFRLAVVAAQQSHTQAMVTIETDEQRVARETAELAKAMQDNFVVIGHSAEEAAAKVSLSWSSAMDAVRKGQGTMSGTIHGIAPGAAGSSTRYDDYGNPYGYVPGVNAPGKLSPGGSGMNVSIFAQGAFFDTPESINRLAEKVGSALVTRHQAQGGQL